ncbi:Flp pilus assembly protein TadD [Variovorax boronicumulans]|uniref:tetratricopeptide repeat protein n=1 Tax=Variovorax boronicumulans TaxID=436515 RepID=UPI00277E2039|nr:tetratricopeptide repeat protein [Variovorax boronicumulans]MDQ0086109.1 Flp pilus assembly protein TadD [Variovorax boronicumulans]
MKQPEPTSFDALISQGMTASRANDGVEAIAWFQRASTAQPGAGLPQFLLGAEFAALGNMAQAEAALANATRLAPGFPMARYQLGLLQFSSGRAAMAVLTWQPLLSLPDTDPLPHFVNGFVALAQDRFDEALRHYQQGLALNTTNEALSSDIEKVIAGIKALTPSVCAAESEDASHDDPDNHVLLANYQQQGRAH